jgi:beta-glucosidase
MLKTIVAVYLLVMLMPFNLLAQTGKDKTSLPQLGKSPVKEVIKAMTVEEKARLLVGMGMDLNIPGFSGMDPEDKKIPEKVPGAAGRTHAIARLGIPSLTLSDGPAGVRINPTRAGDTSRTYYATAFPVATLLASSWDTELVHKVGVATGSEVRDYGIDILLAPGMNIHRNPLGGRNFEYYSEDPLVAGKMAAAYVKGVQSNGVGTSIKHFAANNQEFNRMQSNSIISERALREIYLKGFEIAVKEAQPWTVMSSYNLINGTYASQNPELLTTVLRKEWGFKGFVMTDWFAGNSPAAQMKAGNEVIMPGNPDLTKAIIKAVADGTLSEQQLDENVERVLQIILKSPSFKQEKYSSQPDLKANARVVREAAAAGFVLLKNQANALPLASGRKVALYGNASYELISGGTGSGDVNEAYTISIEQGLAAAGFALDNSLKKTYTDYIAEQKLKRPKPQMAFMLPPPIPEMPVEAGSIEQKASEADVAIITIGRNAGEFSDRKVENDFTLSTSEQSLISRVADAFHAKGKKAIVVLNIGGVIEMASWRDQVDAILLAWQPGQEGGHAIADVLGGTVNPSGKLATTFPVRYEDEPSAKNFPGKELTGQKSMINNPFGGKPAETTYEEGIFAGYRYYNTFDIKPAYEFGYGLSYTDFSYGDLQLSSKQLDGTVKAFVTVTNSGKVAGKEVVQLYVSAPAKKLYKPESELKVFAKTGLLQPGQSQTLSFSISAADLASYDTASSSWVTESGVYTIKVGASSLNIKKTATLTAKKDVLVEKVNKVLVPQVEINERKPVNTGGTSSRTK